MRRDTGSLTKVTAGVTNPPQLKSDMRHLSEFKEEIKSSAVERPQHGIMTGVRVLDECGGLLPGEITLIGGTTASFKTTLAINMAVNAAKGGVPAMFIGMEMLERYVAASVMRLSDDNFGLPDCFDIPLWIDCGVNDFVSLLINVVRGRCMAPDPIRLFVVDDVEFLSGVDGVGASKIAMRLNALAEKTGAHILFTAREPRRRDEIGPSIRFERYEAAQNIISVCRPGLYDKPVNYAPDVVITGFEGDDKPDADLLVIRHLMGRTTGVGGACVMRREGDGRMINIY